PGGRQRTCEPKVAVASPFAISEQQVVALEEIDGNSDRGLADLERIRASQPIFFGAAMFGERGAATDAAAIGVRGDDVIDDTRGGVRAVDGRSAVAKYFDAGKQRR